MPVVGGVLPLSSKATAAKGKEKSGPNGNPEAPHFPAEQAHPTQTRTHLVVAGSASAHQPHSFSRAHPTGRSWRLPQKAEVRKLLFSYSSLASFYPTSSSLSLFLPDLSTSLCASLCYPLRVSPSFPCFMQHGFVSSAIANTAVHSAPPLTW